MPGDLTRGARPPADTGEPVRRGRNLIATIGIDKYPFFGSLRNAVRDAEDVLRLFTEKLEFREVGTRLRDEAATGSAIMSLIQDELPGEVEPDDSLVVFFSGHGCTERFERAGSAREVGFIVPTEGRKPEEGKWSTLIRLEAFLQAVADLPARHILVVLDSCHSGRALDNSVRTSRGYEKYNDEMVQRPSRTVITSAMADEAAADSGPVPGHSLFTGLLVQGLESEDADAGEKGFVTSAELGVYLQREVTAWNRSAQAPAFGAFSDADQGGQLIIPLRGENYQKGLARDGAAAGDAIYELGRLTGDPDRFASAARSYREALKQAERVHMAFPLAEVGLARSLLAAKDPEAAVKVLSDLLSREDAGTPPEANYLLGLAHALAGRAAEATAAFEAFVQAAPTAAEAAWVRDYVQRLSSSTQAGEGKRRGLLVGIDHYRTENIPPLSGCVNDARNLMGRLLARFGFDEGDVAVLTDGDATRERFLAELGRLAAESSPADTVFIHFSGHSLPPEQYEALQANNPNQTWLILYDTQVDETPMGAGLSAKELHRSVMAIPALHKTVILDTHGCAELFQLARTEGDYALILASDMAEIAYEWRVDLDGVDMPCGMLTGALYKALDQLRNEDITYGEWLQVATAIAVEASQDFPRPQTPLLIGLKDARVFGGDPYATLALLRLRGAPLRDAPAELEGPYRSLSRQMSVPLPGALEALGRAALVQSAQTRGEEALRLYHFAVTALEPAAGADLDLPERLALAHAFVGVGRYSDASAALGQAGGKASDDLASRLDELIPLLDALAQGSRTALLVAVDRYAGRNRGRLYGPGNDARALKQVLCQRWGFAEDKVLILADAEATEDAVRSAFAELAAAGQTSPCLFYFAGYGARTTNKAPLILVHDSVRRNKPGIAVAELADVAGQSVNLWTILDCAFVPGKSRRGLVRAQGAVTVPNEARPSQAVEQGAPIRVGAVTVAPRERAAASDAVPVERSVAGAAGDGSAVRSELSLALVAYLAQAQAGATVLDLRRELEATLNAQAKQASVAEQEGSAASSAVVGGKELRMTPPHVVASDEHLTLFTGETSRDALRLARLVALEPLRRIAAQLDELVERRANENDLWPEGRLNAGLAHAGAGDYGIARQRLEEALDIVEGRDPRKQEMAFAA